jgi:hypothetical protein
MDRREEERVEEEKRRGEIKAYGKKRRVREMVLAILLLNFLVQTGVSCCI